ncbi:carboxylating nicotinate-nucleotide diphosphorylase [Bacillus vallismortis]|uniref:carboxylating nicotinate-nucleotide diphosphorylase n=1 Tax=Bacillus vallismortis TaxID=72361 RepID=UPI00227E1760|nr:carboxylating nicotinate-nucleotide diphosphorylase [Bacillus vallismortis]MCI3983740.1 carboxylating nicotinate-nucleotide diphosphorylase [Bacillus vallismortis]MCY7893505.1 carboxylating nicotinate-nucleotide diphosphorylase [Bacillus vallismortis]
MNHLQLKKMLNHFFLEDIGMGDLTSQSIFGEQSCEAKIVAKSDGIFAGAAVIKEGFMLLDQDVQTRLHKTDGDILRKGEVIAVLRGPAAALLSGERVVLNLIQRLSGIATMTGEAVRRLDDEQIEICDTRKTTPGLRMLEKYAVKAGGGSNHRFGLYDGIMIKDNHIAACGSITEACQKARRAAGHMVKIEVEIETEEQLREAIDAGADVIMFDNCPPETVRHFATLTPDHIKIEASGGITLETLPAFKGTGVDYISLGFLTHSVKSLDISMDVTLSNESVEECHYVNS